LIQDQLSIEERVFLLGVYTKKDEENLRDVLLSLANTGMFTTKDGKKILKKLQKSGFIVDGELSFKGLAEAKKAKEEFSL
jgi:hypothetical protein